MLYCAYLIYIYSIENKEVFLKNCTFTKQTLKSIHEASVITNFNTNDIFLKYTIRHTLVV